MYVCMYNTNLDSDSYELFIVYLRAYQASGRGKMLSSDSLNEIGHHLWIHINSFFLTLTVLGGGVKFTMRRKV